MKEIWMKINSIIGRRFPNILSYTSFYITLSFILLFFAFGIRFFEASLFYFYKGIFQQALLWNMQGLIYDISIYLKASCLILPLFLIFSYFNFSVSKLVLRILYSILILLALVSVVFFCSSDFFLDKVVFAYSLEEIRDIIKASNSNPVWVYIVLAALPVTFFIVSRKASFTFKKVPVLVFLCTLVIIWTIPAKVIKFTNDDAVANDIRTNKVEFFYQSLFQKKLYLKIASPSDYIQKTTEFRQYFPEYEFTDTKYPFLYQAEYKDVLSPFFNLKKSPPNFVFIIVEGLGKSISQTPYQLMPFLDSLAEHSLSWEHCVSVSARTFGVLPAIFGALPCGEKGFMDMCPNEPDFYSLLKTARENQYQTGFFYGGNIDFDHMSDFMGRNETPIVIHEWDESIKRQAIGGYWGYEDHLTFRQAINSINFNSHPRMDVYLTTSSHAPWEYPDKNHYLNILQAKIKYLKQLWKNNPRNLDQINFIEANKNAYASYLYVDNSLRDLLKLYQTQKGFDNTIFIITGDHSAFTKQSGGYSNYHVPLIMWSPMLKAPRKMKGVVSHRDLTPTIMALLKAQYQMKVPGKVAWLNHSVDTSLAFRAGTFSPLQSIDHSLSGIMYKNYFLSEGKLFLLTDTDNPSEIKNASEVSKIQYLFRLYASLDQYVWINNTLIESDEVKSINKQHINIFDTIAPGSYFAKETSMKIISHAGHNTTLAFTNEMGYPGQLLAYKLDALTSNFYIEVSFDYNLEGTDLSTNDFITVVRNLKGQDTSYYIPDYIRLTDGEWKNYTYKAKIRKDSYKLKGDVQYDIYLWNPCKLQGYFDNIKVKCVSD